MDKYSGTWKSKVRESMLNNKEDEETLDTELNIWEDVWLRKPHQYLPKKCYWDVCSLHSSNISEHVPGIKFTCSYTSNNMQLWKINIKFANIEKLFEINNGSGTILFFYSFIAYGRAINNWFTFTFTLVIYIRYGSEGCLHPTIQW